MIHRNATRFLCIARSYRLYFRLSDRFIAAERVISHRVCAPRVLPRACPINESDEIIDRSHVNVHDRAIGRAPSDRIIATSDLGPALCFHPTTVFRTTGSAASSPCRRTRVARKIDEYARAQPPVNEVTSLQLSPQQQRHNDIKR